MRMLCYGGTTVLVWHSFYDDDDDDDDDVDGLC
jgi:hypothetical protein